MLEEKINKIKEDALAEILAVESLAQLNDLRIKFLGRKSEFTNILKSLKDLTEQERKTVGQIANATKIEVESVLAEKEKELKEKSFDFAAEKIDVTMPAKKLQRGHLHPLSKIQYEIEDIFNSMGFEIADGPEVETEFYNFDALNIPKDHPARDMQDTFWLKDEGKDEKVVMRTQTSDVQIRFMEKHTPPFRIIAPGRVFRRESTDTTHDHTFHQFEALMVGEDITVGNLKFVAEQFFSKFFKADVEIRLRPSYFPFTEPSFEFDINCLVCGGKGCSSCKWAGWLELGGAGIVNQNVFEAVGYPRNKYQGFAWGFGLERLAMMKYKIDDVRLFHSGDLRFIKQF
ncbi:MAG: Phenylalanine-tRNA ligase alpha subunit [Candidatus Moranbacteria bacterium GW2011_GWC2_37_73]|nr:MAG: phenylalanyl-tRNA synthetase, alpha subunit, phenylalanyl-tRNA synthetase alpha chain [Parcubacteria group bacterium GW2011_GWC1_36_108]KKQ00645.1 MAG: Phenylalanine-tRNA ligase alpha subunit [Candidatus Moranbacteria bacterium GW2011_GWD1_36_198]KKQ01933.1 MAG: Phenylalanine-tRNA ligase alpha subunit [Candidatus Moranbacteria bacterium GW2011_GWD2_36_198]KKQ39486.1 MAG: Phenylalanine-tRNA ligase alpha subunit [Candidatus Moranbacteria bacterium GW2011_GWC2_37_73]HAR99795.1 phenylalanin